MNVYNYNKPVLTAEHALGVVSHSKTLYLTANARKGSGDIQ